MRPVAPGRHHRRRLAVVLITLNSRNRQVHHLRNLAGNSGEDLPRLRTPGYQRGYAPKRRLFSRQPLDLGSRVTIRDRLAALALAPAPANAPAGGAAAARATFPAQIPPAIARAAGMTAAGLAVAALVLFGLVVGGANSAAPAATGTALKTTTIGGMTVLTNAKGFTLYSFAPDTPASSKCYGSCAVYWPPVTGTTAAGQGLRGKVTTITRTDGSHQLTYNGHPLYTYIGDTAPGQARGNNLNLNGGLWHEVPASR